MNSASSARSSQRFFALPRLAALLVLVAWLGLFAVPALATELALEGGWRVAASGEQARSVGRDDAGLSFFDPAIYQSFRGGETGSWVLLWPAAGDWPQPPWVLEAIGPGLQTLIFYPPGSDTGQQSSLMARDSRIWPGHSRLAFPVFAAPAAGEPLRLHVDSRGVTPAVMTFSVRPVVEHLRADARWLALASACLAVMVAMAVVALFFALRLRDMTFFHYAMYVLGYVMILALQTGYVYEPLGWDTVARSVQVWGRVAVAISVVFAVLFLDRFCDLRRYVPLGRRLLLAYAAVVTIISVLLFLPISSIEGIGRNTINPLLILGGPAILLVSMLAAWRGSRYARFFLLGWTPLLVVTVIGSLHQFNIAMSWTWSADAMLITGVFETLVLSLALADRSLALRRDRDQARRLADIDPLTGLYNRRAWSERLLRMEQTMHMHHRPLSVLFLDLDHFKELNDRLGHAAGDVALRELARVMRDELGDEGQIGRYGGEEFVIAMPNSSREQAMHLAQRIRQRLRDRVALDPHAATPTVSIGVASWRTGEDMSALLRRADEAMYAAKAAGRDRVVSAE